MHPTARTLTMLSSLALVSSIGEGVARAAEHAAAREYAAPGQPVPGCLGCEAATMASTSGATTCEPHRAFFASAAAARDALRAQPLPAALQKPVGHHGPNRAQRRAAVRVSLRQHRDRRGAR